MQAIDTNYGGPWLVWAYFVVYFTLGLLWPSLRVWRATGVHPIRLPATDDAHGYVGRMFKALLGLCFVMLLAHAWWPDWAAVWMPPLPMLAHGMAGAIGGALLVVSTVLLLCAQRQMGLSWRVGLDADAPGPLVTKGLFARSRNPIYLSMRISLLGLLCVQPHAGTLVIWACAEVLLQVQVRLEEPHLTALYGHAYAHYSERVRRWC